MKYDDIDDLLINIEESQGQLKASKEEPAKKESPKKPEKPAESSNIHETTDLSFLENVDSNDPAEKNREFEESLKQAVVESKDEEPDKSAEKKPEEKPRPIKTEKQPAFTSVVFKVRGTRSWNTREPYVIEISEEKLDSDYKDLTRTFYFIKEQDSEQAVQSEMKRALFKFIRGSGKNITDEYSAFIGSRLFSLVADWGTEFGFQKDMLHLFVYHLGVLSLYKILLLTFQSGKTGYCFKALTGNNVVKYIPQEFIKELILKWHNENINSNALQYDGIIEYNELKRVVSKKYSAEFEKINSRLDDLIAKSNLNVSPPDREQILKSKWDEWFGKINILIYNRFLERTIFKMVK
ncbi:MAG: hypothetical protein V1874_09375 [Spirochaetota bacterium]